MKYTTEDQPELYPEKDQDQNGWQGYAGESTQIHKEIARLRAIKLSYCT